jgi:hypothetical protein
LLLAAFDRALSLDCTCPMKRRGAEIAARSHRRQLQATH